MASRPRVNLWLLAASFAASSGCGGYEIKNLAKSDINLVTDEFIFETRTLVRTLLLKPKS